MMLQTMRWPTTNEQEDEAAAERTKKRMKTDANDGATKSSTVVGWGANMYPPADTWKCLYCTSSNPSSAVEKWCYGTPRAVPAPADSQFCNRIAHHQIQQEVSRRSLKKLVSGCRVLQFT
jgi:hypothetical protein